MIDRMLGKKRRMKERRVCVLGLGRGSDLELKLPLNHAEKRWSRATTMAATPALHFSKHVAQSSDFLLSYVD